MVYLVAKKLGLPIFEVNLNMFIATKTRKHEEFKWYCRK